MEEADLLNLHAKGYAVHRSKQAFGTHIITEHARGGSVGARTRKAPGKLLDPILLKSTSCWDLRVREAGWD